MTTIRELKHNQIVDTDAVLHRLASIRAEAKEVRDDATTVNVEFFSGNRTTFIVRPAMARRANNCKRQQSNLSVPSPSRHYTHMETSLELRPSTRIGSARVLIDPNHVYHYDVVGLPSGQSATIPKTNSFRWKVWRTQDGAKGRWEGDYGTAEEVLKEIQKELVA